MKGNFLITIVAAGLLAGCSSTREAPKPPQLEVSKKPGGYYLDDGPGSNPPPNLQNVPDAVPRDEPLHRFANKPYQIMGVSYTPMSERESFSQEGVASWYGKRYHGKKTSSGEIYDMYAMSAAHPTLPIPSYARVTSLDNGRSVIVRINDRGPFHSDRVIDLSYTAAYKLGLLGKGSGMVRVENVNPATGAVALNPPAENTNIAQGMRNPDQGAGYYVQLGAFGNLANAEKLVRHARETLDIPADQVQVVLVGSLHRVKLGPFADQAEASAWVDKSRDVLGISAIKVTN